MRRGSPVIRGGKHRQEAISCGSSGEAKRRFGVDEDMMGFLRGVTHIILSLGREEVMAEITSVRQDLTFSVMPSLSIMII